MFNELKLESYNPDHIRVAILRFAHDLFKADCYDRVYSSILGLRALSEHHEFPKSILEPIVKYVDKIFKSKQEKDEFLLCEIFWMLLNIVANHK